MYLGAFALQPLLGSNPANVDTYMHLHNLIKSPNHLGGIVEWLLVYYYSQPSSTLELSSIGLCLYLDCLDGCP